MSVVCTRLKYTTTARISWNVPQSYGGTLQCCQSEATIELVWVSDYNGLDDEINMETEFSSDTKQKQIESIKINIARSEGE